MCTIVGIYWFFIKLAWIWISIYIFWIGHIFIHSHGISQCTRLAVATNLFLGFSSPHPDILLGFGGGPPYKIKKRSLQTLSFNHTHKRNLNKWMYRLSLNLYFCITWRLGFTSSWSRPGFDLAGWGESAGLSNAGASGGFMDLEAAARRPRFASWIYLKRLL